MSNIKKISKFDQPRERLVKNGSNNLATYEIVAILLGSGYKNNDVLKLSQDVCQLIENIKPINLTIEKLMSIKGIKLAKAATIIAALELGKRLQESSIVVNKKLSNDDIYKYFHNKLIYESREKLYLLIVNARGFLIKKIHMSTGSSLNVIVERREIFSKVLEYNGVGFILVHNHPSGDCSPSPSDIDVTNKIVDSSEKINIFFIDHIIIGKDEYFSFKKKKKTYIKNPSIY